MADGGEVPERPYHALKAIPDIDAKILAGIAQGRSLQSIADDYGVHDTAVLMRALRNYPEEYKAAARTGYELRMDRREKELESADSNVSVTRADRLLNHARWLAERSCPDRWGVKQEIEHKGGFKVEIVRFGRTYDTQGAEVTDATPVNSLTDKANAHDE